MIVATSDDDAPARLTWGDVLLVGCLAVAAVVGVWRAAGYLAARRAAARPRPEPTPQPELWVTVDGEHEMSLSEYRVLCWRQWLREFWQLWAHFDYCGRRKLEQQTNIKFDFYSTWQPAMQYLQSLGLIIVEERKPVEVLVKTRGLALAVIAHRAILPAPDLPVPDRIVLPYGLAYGDVIPSPSPTWTAHEWQPEGAPVSDQATSFDQPQPAQPVPPGGVMGLTT